MKINVLVFSALILATSSTTLYCFVKEAIPSYKCIRSIDVNEINRVDVAIGMAYFCRTAMMFKEALAFYERAQSIEPNIEADFGIFKTLLESQNYFDAMTKYYGLLAKYGFAYTTRIDQILKETNFNVTVKDEKDQMTAKYYTNDLDKALQIAKKYVKNNEFGTYHLLYERILYKSKNYFAALYFVRHWLKKQPNNFYLHHLYGSLLMQHLKFSDAIRSLEESARLQPIFQLSRYSLALCQQQTGKFEYSLETLRILLKIVSEQPWGVTSSIYNAMGYSYQELQMFKYAYLAYRSALEGNTTPYLTHYNIANLYFQMNKFEEALKEAQIAHEIDKSMEMPKILMAHCLKQLNRHYEAKYLLKDLINIEALTLLAEVYYELEDEKAEETVDKVLYMDYNVEQAHIIKGMINYKNGFFDKAIQSYEKCKNEYVLKMKIRLLSRLHRCQEANKAMKGIEDTMLNQYVSYCVESTDL